MNTVVQVKDKKFALYISEEKIKARVKEVANQIDEDLRKKNPLFLVILNGSFVFAADLLRDINLRKKNARKDHTVLHRMQAEELQHLQEQEERPRSYRVHEVLPLLPQAHPPQGIQVITRSSKQWQTKPKQRRTG